MHRRNELSPFENVLGMIGFLLFALFIIYFFVQRTPSAHKNEARESPQQTTTPKKETTPSVTISDPTRAA